MADRPNRENFLAEAHVLVSLQLKKIGLRVPHLFVSVTPNGQFVLRSNVSPDVLRSFGEEEARGRAVGRSWK